MSFFFWASLLLLLATATYHLVFMMFAYYWHEKEMSVAVVPLLFTFEFFMTWFLVITLVSLVVAYWPDIMNLVRLAIASHNNATQ